LSPVIGRASLVMMLGRSLRVRMGWWGLGGRGRGPAELVQAAFAQTGSAGWGEHLRYSSGALGQVAVGMSEGLVAAIPFRIRNGTVCLPSHRLLLLRPVFPGLSFMLHTLVVNLPCVCLLNRA
jgi:hypothetical protein